MKVLKKGKAQGWTQVVKCKHCGAKLEVTNKDCTWIPGPRPDDVGYTFTCPECKSGNVLPGGA